MEKENATMLSEESVKIRKNKKKPIAALIIITIVTVIVVAIIIAVNVSGNSNKKYRKAMELATQYYDEMDYEKAIVYYKEAIDIEPKEAEAYLGLADVYMAMAEDESNIDKKLEYYNAALLVLNDALDNDVDDNEAIKNKISEIENYISQTSSLGTEENVTQNEEMPQAENNLPSTFNEEVFLSMYYDLLDCAYYDGVKVDENFDLEAAVSGYRLDDTYEDDYVYNQVYNRTEIPLQLDGENIVESYYVSLGGPKDYNSKSLSVNYYKTVIIENGTRGYGTSFIVIGNDQEGMYYSMYYSETIWPGMEPSIYGHGFYDVMEKYGCSNVYDVLELWGISNDETDIYNFQDDNGMIYITVDGYCIAVDGNGVNINIHTDDEYVWEELTRFSISWKK